MSSKAAIKHGIDAACLHLRNARFCLNQAVERLEDCGMPADVRQLIVDERAKLSAVYLALRAIRPGGGK